MNPWQKPDREGGRSAASRYALPYGRASASLNPVKALQNILRR